MSIPRFAIMNTARKMNKTQVPEQTNENDVPKSQYSSNIPSFSSTSMHPYEVQMLTHSVLGTLVRSSRGMSTSSPRVGPRSSYWALKPTADGKALGSPERKH